MCNTYVYTHIENRKERRECHLDCQNMLTEAYCYCISSSMSTRLQTYTMCLFLTHFQKLLHNRLDETHASSLALSKTAIEHAHTNIELHGLMVCFGLVSVFCTDTLRVNMCVYFGFSE